MSKPTERQRALLMAIRGEMDVMIGSNDLHSPSHDTSILDYIGVVGLEHEIPEAIEDAITEHVAAIWVLVANLDPCTNRK